MKKFLKVNLFALTSIFILSCNNDDNRNDDGNAIISKFEWKKLGLDDIKINEMDLVGNVIYVATENGVYKKDIGSSGDFIQIGLQGKNIEDILVFSEQDILASVAGFAFPNEFVIMETTDGGVSWQVLESNFGGGGEPQVVFDFEKDPIQESTIYATSNFVIAKSLDRGTTWAPIWGFWEAFARGTSKVAVNPLFPNQIWAGGQGALEDGYLVRLEDETEANVWTDLVQNPTTVKEIVFDSQSPQNIYIGFEGGLLKTSDNGLTWNTLIDRHEEARFFNGIGVSTMDQNLVFSGGWLKTAEPQPLLLFYSLDKGATWEEELFASEPFGGIQDMIVKSEEGTEHIYLGLDKGGVYEVVFKNE